MNNTALAIIEPQELDTIQRTAKLLAASGFFGTSGDATTAMAQVAAKILAGRELGFGPFAAVNGIHLIQGKPAIGANLMAAAVRSHPRYDYRVKELTDKVCELEFFDGGKLAGNSRFTIAEAATAELSTGKNQATWKKFPRNMLFARAMSNGVRWYAPDIFSGNTVYVPEELDVRVDGEGNVIDTTYIVAKPEVSPERQVDASTGEIMAPNMAPVPKDSLPVSTDVIFQAEEPPTDEEHDIITIWQSSQDAYVWSVNVGACGNIHEAENSMRKVVREKGLKFTAENKLPIFLAFLRHQNTKLAQQPIAQVA